MHWVLILIIGVSQITSLEISGFNSKDSCQSALEQIRTDTKYESTAGSCILVDGKQ